MFLSNLSIKRPVVATVMMLALVTIGIFSFRRLSVEMMPDVEIPVLSVITEYPGASPETVEREVSKIIEEALNPIAGVKHVNSISREGLSTVIVEFNLEVKIDDVSQEARAKINAVRRELPETMKDPVIQKLQFNAMPVISLAVQSKTLPARELTTLADRRIKRRLERIPGVAKAKLVGSSLREIAVDVDPAKLAGFGMGIDEVAAGLASENINTPLGRLTRGGTEMPLRISGKPKDAASYRSMVISRRNGQPITLGDVATITDGVEEQRSLALINGQPAVAIDVTKQTKANTIQVVDGVRAAVEELQKEMPAGIQIQVVRDTSTFIREAVADVYNTLILGGLLTIAIVFLFLNSWRSTIITGLTLPISVISSFIVMYFLGMTLNMLTLMALSLAIGLLIDDAIVVRENIVRHLEKGQDHFEAARQGTAEIGLAVLATSMSIMAVFVPVAFMKGVIGRFFYQFGLTVAFAVLVSLFVSFTLDPMLSSRWIDPDIDRKGKRAWWHHGLDWFNDRFEAMADGYKRLIGWALDHRVIVSGAAILAFVAGLAILGMLQTEFMTTMDQGEFAMKFKSAPGSSVAETKSRMEAVLKGLSSFKEVQYTYAAIGAGDTDTVRDATVFVRLVPEEQRDRTTRQFIHEARLRLQTIPGVQLNFLEDPDSFQKPLAIYVKGDDIATLKKYAAQLKEEMYKVPGIVDIEASGEQDLPEYRLTVDRERAAASGLGSGAVASTVATLIGGQAVSTYEDDEGEAVNVRVRLPQSLRSDVAQVADLKVTVPGAQGAALIPLADLVTFTRATSPAEINRLDMSRQVTVDANLDGVPLGTASSQALARGQAMRMMPGYSLGQGGDAEIMIESFGYMGEALVLAIIFVYLILAAQFESFIDPLSIMLSLPLSIVGMAGTLLLTGDTINMMSLIGLIMLMGLVTKNAILLVDFTKVLRRQGMDRRTALITAGRTRLRPILMTTTAMIFGMLPLFFALGQGAELRAPMARAVVGGLITSTILTLIVVPVVYSLLDDVTAWIFRKKVRPAQAAAVGVLIAALVVGGSAPASAQSALSSGSARPSMAVIVDQAAAQAAAQGQSGPKVLTLDQALQIAAAQNHDIQKAIEYQKWVQGKYLEQRANALPQAKFSGSFVRNFDNTSEGLYSSVFGGFGDTTAGSEFTDIFSGRRDMITGQVTVNQVIFTWGQVGAAIRAAKLGFGVADDQLRRFRQAVVRDVTTAYYDVLVTRELAKIAEADLAQKQRHLDETTKRQQAGTATDYDVLAARVQAENARPAVISTQNAIRTARLQLGVLLADTSEIDVTGNLDAPIEPAPAYDAVLAKALGSRPELSEMKNTAGVYRELITIAKAGSKPRVDFSASFGLGYVGLKAVSSHGSLWNAGVVASVPLFDGWRTKGQVAQAQTDLARLSQDDLKLRDNIVLQVRGALDAVREASETVTALSGTVTQAERLLFLSEKGFELGVKTRLEVQDAELNLSAARANLARAQRNYRVARVNLEWVSGTLDGGAPSATPAPAK